MRTSIITLLAIFSILTCTGYAVAEDDKWHFELTPVFWASGIDIDTTTVRGRNASAGFDFNDILDTLDFGGSIQFEAWKGQWGLIVEELYIDLGVDGNAQPRIGPRVDADLDIRLNLLEMAVTHRFDMNMGGHQPEAANNSFQPKLFMEPMAGLRYGTIKQEINLKLTPSQLPAIGETTGTFEGSDWWIELFAGGRVKYRFSQNWILILRGDLGGINSGDETVFSWKLYAGLDYKPWKSTSLKIGYNIYDFNYENNTGDEKFELDAMLHGPAIGLTFYF